MKLYKVTNKDGNTKNNTHWDIGVTHEVTGVPKLCTSTVLHAYTSPLLAALLWPLYSSYKPERFFVCEGEVVVSDGTKVGCQKLTVLGTFELPELTTSQRIAFGILSALQVYKHNAYQQWANNWLTGKNRFVSAAVYAANAVYAAGAAAYAAAYAAKAATVYIYAAKAATYATNAAATVDTSTVIDLEQLAQEALKY